MTTQVLTFKLKLKHLVIFSGKKELLEYEIQMWDFYLINVTDASEAEIRIVFRRLLLFSLFIKIY